MVRLAALGMLVAALSACGGSGDGGPRVVVDGLDGPTQFVDGPDGVLVVAQLAGDENAAAGEVISIDLDSGERTVLLGDLDKPTGVAWSDGTLWVMVRRGLLRADWTGGEVGPVEVVLDDLPYNGRSEGTLTVLSDGDLVYETSGSIADGAVVEGSGALWRLDVDSGASSLLATGVKNGYGHALAPDGALVFGDVGDNIADPPVDELNVLDVDAAPVEFGWPDCPGDRVCGGVTGPLALFDVAATPTGVAVADGEVLVSLFVTGQVVSVPLADWTVGDPPRVPKVVASGLAGPHSVVVRPDGALWVSEHGAGRIVELG